MTGTRSPSMSTSVRCRQASSNYAIDGREDVDPMRRNADLDDDARRTEVVATNDRSGRAERRQRAFDTRGVFVRRADPDIEIGGRARNAVGRDRVGADDEKFSVRGGQRGQHVAEVGIQQLALLL